jgi:hypothetical protein
MKGTREVHKSRREYFVHDADIYNKTLIRPKQ